MILGMLWWQFLVLTFCCISTLIAGLAVSIMISRRAEQEHTAKESFEPNGESRRINKDVR